ncbi:MAG: peptidylprolyl isomerase [Gemmataceae bacterium]
MGAGRWVGWVVLLGGLVMLGCGKQPPASQEAGAPRPEQPAATTQASLTATTEYQRLHQPFAVATITDPPPPDQWLPDVTMTGKSVGKLYLEVSRRWDQVRFLDEAGRQLCYKAVLDTELGEVEIALKPEWAPNHARNFIVLAQIGYYDGLVFQRIIHEQSDANPQAKIDMIEAGCPMGTGDPGYGSIGYWLKPEFDSKLPHEEGVIGACRDQYAESAACKFYVTLCKAPILDGEFTVFGKITRGLDVAQRISTQPIRNDPEYPEGDRPEKPIVIRKVTIHVQPMDSVAAK